MFEYLANNISTIITSIILIIIVVLIIKYIIRRKKSGKLSCGCSCSNCPNSDMCNKK